MIHFPALTEYEERYADLVGVPLTVLAHLVPGARLAGYDVLNLDNLLARAVVEEQCRQANGRLADAGRPVVMAGTGVRAELGVPADADGDVPVLRFEAREPRIERPRIVHEHHTRRSCPTIIPKHHTWAWAAAKSVSAASTAAFLMST